mmetsp:Transcript_3765/g.5679  ORF Transcript_3765/g.5679 Transcript_3765/m.5679 type:complete len:193 (-) Transcript_3765:1541-2119(-)
MERLPDLETRCGVPDIPLQFRMGKKGFTCSIRALFAFNGTQVFKKRLTPVEMARCLGPRARVVHFSGGSRPHAKAVPLHSENRDCMYLAYVGSDGDSKTAQTQRTDSAVEPVWRTRRVILVIWDEFVFPNGHCMVLWPPKDLLPASSGTGSPPQRWALRDPWRCDGKAMALDATQVDLVVASASTLICLEED